MQRPDAVLFTGAAVPTVLTGGVLSAVAAGVAGGHAALGAGLGTVLVLVFFGATLLVLGRALRTTPQRFVVVGLASYVAKIVVLGVFLAAFRDTTRFDGRWFAAGVGVGTLVWLPGEIRAFMRLRTPYVVPGGAA